MGLTRSSGGRRASDFSLADGHTDDAPLVVMAGNPNVGKSSLFNALTGLHQHTGNWTGKTVGCAVGTLKNSRRKKRGGKGKGTSPLTEGGSQIRLADLPGCYSLCPRSAEEQAALEFLLASRPSAAVVVCDPLNLERNLLLALQLTALLPHGRIILCVNLIDEAARVGVTLRRHELEELSGFPVVLTSARTGEGLSELAEVIREKALSCESLRKTNNARPPEISPTSVYQKEAQTLARTVIRTGKQRSPVRRSITQVIDNVVLGKATAIPVALLFLALTLWLTLYAANKPSEWLSAVLNRLGRGLAALSFWSLVPPWVSGLLLDGVYATVAWVVSVMLPPMAIFFPLFTLLEDLGFLPRIAFNFDRCFQSCAACGKQALTMCMGLGCTAAGVTGCRIIDSPRERMIAVLTNAFMPCNGKFPTLLCLSAVLITQADGSDASGAVGSLRSALIVTACVLLCILVTLGVSRLLSVTLLRGQPSSFLLELPPYRLPRVGQVLWRSLCDRTLFVLGRAVTAAAPAGAILWLCTHLTIGRESLTAVAVEILDPVGAILCVDGAILLALLLSAPANELTLPILLMLRTAGNTLSAVSAGEALTQSLSGAGLGLAGSIAFLILFLFHAPCTTTLMTIRRETGKRRWALAGAVIPAAVGVILCLLLRLGLLIFGS